MYDYQIYLYLHYFYTLLIYNFLNLFWLEFEKFITLYFLSLIGSSLLDVYSSNIL